MNTNITKLTAAMDAKAVPAGMELFTLNYKMTKEGVKRNPAYYLAPDLSEQMPIAVEEGFEQAALMLYKELSLLQREELYALEDGDLTAADRAADVRLLAERYFTHGRSLGVKQEAIETWIVETLKPMLQARIARNMPTVGADKRGNLIAALVEQFQIAATRNNQIKNKSLTVPALEDLGKRLTAYSVDGELESCDELTAMQNRIKKHLGKELEVVGVVDSF